MTERLAMHADGWKKSGVLLLESHVKEEDMPLFERVKHKLVCGPIELDEIVYALARHDKKDFLDTL